LSPVLRARLGAAGPAQTEPRACRLLFNRVHSAHRSART
jgi:hypothetical protein